MQLQITFNLKKPFCVPFNYNHQLQSAVYAKLAQVGVSDFWHNEGFGDNGSFKLFVIGPLIGSYTISDKHLCFTDTLSFEVRSPVFDFCDQLQRSLELYPTLRFFDTDLEVCDVKLTNLHINSSHVSLYTASPITVRTVDSDNKTIYYSPADKEFICGIKRILYKKYLAAYSTAAEEIEIIPVGTHKKTVTRYKGTWITAYSGRYEVSGNSRVIEFLYNAGAGMKTAQGFGLMKIIEQN